MHLFICKYPKYFTFRTGNGHYGSVPYQGENEYEDSLGRLQLIFNTSSLEVRKC